MNELQPVPSLVDASGPRELALPADLEARARDYVLRARADRTWDAYRRAWQGFEAWCAKHGRRALPASPKTVAAWMTALADGDGIPKPLSRSSIAQALSAVIVFHRLDHKPLDRKHPEIADAWKGISNRKARTELKRQARPLLSQDLQDLVRLLQPDIPADMRDRALLLLGWAAALRRSELIGLDWHRLGDGRGFVRVDDRGVTVTLMGSKASQDAAETIAVPVADMPAAAEALEAWARTADLRAGDAVFHPVDQRQVIGADRLTDRSVARIVKARVRELAKARGRNDSEADELVATFSGHSLRAGYATSAAAANMPSYRIQKHTRHKSAEMVAGYIREADKWANGGLRGLGF